jgi:hypothetical protein
LNCDGGIELVYDKCFNQDIVRRQVGKNVLLGGDDGYLGVGIAECIALEIRCVKILCPSCCERLVSGCFKQNRVLQIDFANFSSVGRRCSGSKLDDVDAY